MKQLLATALLALSVVSAIQASIVVEFEVTLGPSINDPSGVLDGSIHPGDIIAGTFSYDPTSADSDVSPLAGSYASPEGLVATVGNYVLMASTHITIIDGQGPGTVPAFFIDDQYYVNSGGATFGNGVDLFNDVGFVLHLAGNDGDIWSSDALQPPPLFSDFRGRNWIMIGFVALPDGSQSRFDLDGTVTKLQPFSGVPEPSAYITWLVLGFTIGGGYWWRRRKNPDFPLSYPPR